MTDTYDLIVIGAGPAGYVAAERAGERKLKTLLIEREDHLGGVCLNWGCIPTKTMLACSKLFYQAGHGAAFGVATIGLSFDLAAVQARKQKVQDGLRQGIRGLMRKYGVTVVKGDAKLVAAPSGDKPAQIAVGSTTYAAKDVLIATGSRPAKPPIPGLDLPNVVDSSGILGLTKLPKRLAIIGGGVIGVEFACFFAQVGVAVEVVELMNEITPGVDPDCARILRNELEGKGVVFRLGHKVAAVTADGVSAVDPQGQPVSVAADLVLCCTGRTPNTDGIGLDKLNIDAPRGLIKVDERGRTNVPGIWAAGDCCSRIMLAHVASRQAEVVVDNLAGGDDRMRWRAVPGVIYTSPEVAGVGLTEATAQADGVPITVAKWPLAANGRFIAENEGRGLCKVIVHKTDRRVLGVHIVGGAASEMIAGATTAIEAELRIDELAQIIWPHPTVSEAQKDAIWPLLHH
ncbi:MAG: dihydrolipoyl dehydrogenase [Planctomycetota bacterium]